MISNDIRKIIESDDGDFIERSLMLIADEVELLQNKIEKIEGGLKNDILPTP